jgi:hypothetical protein
LGHGKVFVFNFGSLRHLYGLSAFFGNFCLGLFFDRSVGYAKANHIAFALHNSHKG